MKVLIASSLREQTGPGPVAGATEFPWPAGSEIRILTVAAEITPSSATAAWHSAEVVDVAELAEAQPVSAGTIMQSAKEAVAVLETRGLRVRGVIVQGNPDTAIAEYARDWGADVIVVGSSDRSTLSRLLAGSISQSVIQHAPCSVLVIKQSEEEREEAVESRMGATPADATI